MSKNSKHTTIKGQLDALLQSLDEADAESLPQLDDVTLLEYAMHTLDPAENADVESILASSVADREALEEIQAYLNNEKQDPAAYEHEARLDELASATLKGPDHVRAILQDSTQPLWLREKSLYTLTQLRRSDDTNETTVFTPIARAAFTLISVKGNRASSDPTAHTMESVISFEWESNPASVPALSKVACRLVEEEGRFHIRLELDWPPELAKFGDNLHLQVYLYASSSPFEREETVAFQPTPELFSVSLFQKEGITREETEAANDIYGIVRLFATSEIDTTVLSLLTLPLPHQDTSHG